jgi:hypothetical protein
MPVPAKFPAFEAGLALPDDPWFNASMAPRLSERIILAVAILIPASVAIAHWLLAPPIISHDTIIGFETWRSMQQGAGWNQLLAPDPADISRSSGGFLTWWSPGQYLPAGLLMGLGASMGAAVLLISFAGACSLVFGMWRLCLAMGSSGREAALAALAAAATWHTLYAFGMFNGGEVALMAVWPWILLCAWRLQDRPWLQALVLPLLLVAGSYAKLSFGLYAIGLLVFLWLEAARERQWQWRNLLANGVRLAAAGGVYLAVWYWIHLSRGPVPMDKGIAVAPVTTCIGFALSAPWFAAAGFGSMVGRLFAIRGIASDAGWEKLHAVLAVSGAAGAVSYGYLLCHRRRLMRLAGTVCFVAALLLAVLMARGGAISLEDRHLRPAGVLLLAVCASWAASRRAWPRVVFATALALAVLYGLGASVQRIVNGRMFSVRASNHIGVLDIDRDSLRLLERLDVAGSVIYLQNLNLAPVVQHARVIVADNPSRDEAWHAANPILGRVPALVLVLPESYSLDGRALAVRARFQNYREQEWHRTQHGKWVFWQAGGPPAAP